MRAQARRQGVGDRAHAADRQAGRAAQRDQPRIARAAALQRGERQRPHHQVERRARRRGRHLAADYRERRDQRLRLGRQFELVHQVADVAEQDAAERFLVLEPRQVAHQVLQRGRRFEDRDAEPVGEGLQIGEEGVVARCLARRVGLELGVVALGIAPADVDAVAVERLHQGRVGAHELQAVALELEVLDDLGLERPRRVGDGREVARHELQRRRRSAEPRIAFDHQGAQAGAAEIGRRDQAVVAAADDDGVEAPFLFRADAHFGATSLV